MKDEKIKERSNGGRRVFLKRAAITGAGFAVAVATGTGIAEEHTHRKGAKRWGMVIDLKRCVACKSCTIACKNENKTPPGVAYGVFLEEESGEYPNPRVLAFFRPCMQCGLSSCVRVCPTKATYPREDGIVVVDYKRCIGCRYCIETCPYGARSFDYGYEYIEGDSPYNQVPSLEYGASYGLRKKGKSPIGNVRKCTYCIHLQDEKGDYKQSPACASSCMGKAIHFGDLRNPEARCIAHGEKMQELLSRRGHYRLKEELGNEPAVYYLPS